MPTSIEWFQEAERRGLLNKLSQEQQDWWAEAKRRGLAGGQTEQSEEGLQTQEVQSPGLVEGFGQTAANAFSFGQGSRIAGALNTAPGRALRTVLNPLGTVVSGKEPTVSLSELTPEALSQAYQQGKTQFEQEHQAYQTEHPTASLIGEGVGTVAGFLLPAGAFGNLARTGVAATRVGKAGKLGMLASRVAGEATAGALYEGVRRGFGEGQTDTSEAAKGAVQGAALFGALGVLGGGARIAEEGLVQTATRLAKNPGSNRLLQAVAGQVVRHPVATQRGATLAGLAAEGTTLGALPSYLNDQEITAKDIGTGLAFAAGGRAVAEGLASGGARVRRFVNEPTRMQVQEARDFEARLKGAKYVDSKEELLSETEKLEKGFRSQEDIAVDISEKTAEFDKKYEEEFNAILRQKAEDYANETIDAEIAKISAAKTEEELKSAMRVRDLEDSLPDYKKGDIQHNREQAIKWVAEDYEKYDFLVEEYENTHATDARLETGRKIGGPDIAELEKERTALFDSREDLAREIGKKLGWESQAAKASQSSDSRYLTFKKGDKTVKVRLSDHNDVSMFGPRNSEITLDYRDSARKNVEELETLLLGKDSNGIILPREISTNVQVSATDKEIGEYMKAHSQNPYMTEEKAALNVRQAKERAARRITPTDKLPFKERFSRKAKEIAGKVIGTFNQTRPLEEGIIKAEAVTGRKVAADKNPIVRLNRLNNGGEQEALIAPVSETAQAVEKQYPGTIDGADIYLDAQKRIQFARAEGKVPAQRFVDIVEAYKDDEPVQRIAQEVRKLNQKALDRLYESGRIDKATYKQWKQNDSYVPSWIERYDESGEQLVGNMREQYLRKYTGEGDVYQNPIITSMQQAKQIDTFAELQTAKKEYLELASKTGDATKVPSIVEYKGGPVNFDRNNQIVAWREGKPEVWNVPDRVAQYFNPEVTVPDSLPIKVGKALFGFPLRLYKGGTTAVSLGFSQNNIVRDVQGALIGSKHGEYIGPEMIRSSIKELVQNEPIAKELKKQIGIQTMRDVEQLPGLAEDNIKQFVDMYKAIENGGGEGGQRGILARMFMTALPNGARRIARVSSKATSAALDALSYAGNLGEETTRLSVFKSELKAAAQDQAQYDMWLANPDTVPSALKAQAGEAAREVTLNFRRKMAPWVEGANKYFLPYFKPSILGAMRGFEVLTNPEIAPKAWRTIMNMGILQGLVNGKIVDKKQLADLDAYNNEMTGKNFLFKSKAGNLITIPLAQEFAPLIKMFAGVTEEIYRNATKQQRKDIGREMGQAAWQMVQNYVPGVGYFSEPSNLVVGQIPKVIVEEWVNKDIFSGTPIVSEYLQNRPASIQYTRSTPQTLVQISKLLSKHGYEISPMRLNHIAKTFGSNTAKEMLALTDTVLNENGIGELRPKKEVADNPLVRRFMANLTAPYNQYNLDARRIIEENKGGYEIIRKKETEGLPKEQVRRYMKQYLTYKRAENSIKNLNQLRKKRKEIERKIAIVGNSLRTSYQKGKINKAEYLRRRERTIKAFNTVLDTQSALERQFQLEIIEADKYTKKTDKNTPR